MRSRFRHQTLMPSLNDYQRDAVSRMKNGCILNGGVGSGKSRTSLAYYYTQNGGSLDSGRRMKDPKDLYIITTARKRDTKDWDPELSLFGLYRGEDKIYDHEIVIDSWNNIGKYSDVTGAFFIFDEQRVVGSGPWVKSFLKITKSNDWILLSATPGDTWMDYVPVFLANGFYKNRTEFNREHVIYARFVKYPKVDRYVGTKKLERLRDSILVDMDMDRETHPFHIGVVCSYDTMLYKETGKTRWNPYKNEPIVNAAELCYTWRKICSTSPDRRLKFLEITERHDRVIVFYNFDYEREILLELPYRKGTIVAEWSGHKHEVIPDSDKWVYLVQYTSGCEGWNCIETNVIVFYSPNYSYKVMKQAMGRIDRMNTPFKDLYYYHLKSKSGIELAVARALNNKKNFNESKYVKWDDSSKSSERNGESK